MRICQTPCRGNQLQQAMLVIMGSGVVKINNGYGPCRCSSLGTQLIGCKHLVITKTRNTARRCRALPIGPVEFGVCLSEEVQHMKACSIDSEEILVHVQALQLLICINRNSQLTISIIYLKLLYQILLSLLILFINMCIYAVLHLARQ